MGDSVSRRLGNCRGRNAAPGDAHLVFRPLEIGAGLMSTPDLCFDLSEFTVKIPEGMDITLDDIADEEMLEVAYTWLCKRRRNYPDHADVWNFCRHWKREIARLRRELLEGSYRLGLLSRTTLESGEEVDLFSARDALVLKAFSLVLANRLSFSRNCTHLKGKVGGKGAVRRVWRHLKQHQFVLRTDVRSLLRLYRPPCV